MTRTDEFEQPRPLLFPSAYRILGSVSEAEDAVQETGLRHTVLNPEGLGYPGAVADAWAVLRETTRARR